MRREQILLIAALFITASCGEDATSRFVPAPDRIPDAGTSKNSGNETMVGKTGDSSAAANPAVPTEPTVAPTATTSNCSNLLADFLASVSAHPGIIIRAGDTRTPEISVPQIAGCTLKSIIVGSNGEQLENAGTLSDLVKYSAPTNISEDRSVFLKIYVNEMPSLSAQIPLKLLGANSCNIESGSNIPTRIASCFMPNDAKFDAVEANVYKLPEGTAWLPDFSTLSPVQQLLATNIDVPARNYTEGVPGVNGMNEWFGIRYTFELAVPETGKYELQLSSDDGSKLFLNNTLIIGNDGQHAPQAVSTQVDLSAGRHKMRVDYFQGPRAFIQVQLLWKKPGQTSFEIIPPSALHRPR